MKPGQFTDYLKRTDTYTAACWETLCEGLERFVKDADFETVVLGLSGGIDSAVVACMAAAAVGPTNVSALSLPSPFTPDSSIEDAATLAENLGIGIANVPIDDVLSSWEANLKFLYKGGFQGVAHENLQARIRAVFLMAHANVRESLVLATGNKSELAMGYCTLYGDTIGAVAPIGDVLKTDVYALARHINAVSEHEVIPSSILNKIPSAELRPNHKDEDDLPAYEILDYVIRRCVEEGADPEDVAEEGVVEDLVFHILDTVEAMEFKREQGPPVLCVSEAPFGDGPICVLKV